MAYLFSCVCIDEDESDHGRSATSDVRTDRSRRGNPGWHNKKIQDVIRSGHSTLYDVSSHWNGSSPGRTKDKIVIYTGTEGSRQFIDDIDVDAPVSDDSVGGTYSAFKCGEGKHGTIETNWVWPKGFPIPDAVVNDLDRLEILADTQKTIDRADKNYLSLAHSSDFQLDNSTICRYLEVNHWAPVFPNGQSIAERIMATIEWRCSFPLPVHDLSLLKTELATGKAYVYGRAKDGRPVVYLSLGRENTWDPDGNIQALVYTIERAIRSMKASVVDTICIVDCDGVGMMNAPTTAFLGKVIEVLGKHYPRRNGQIFICNVSSVFYFVWNTISLTLNEMTKKKIQILTSDKRAMRAAIGELVDVSILSEEYGGNASIRFDVDSYLAADSFLQHQQILRRKSIMTEKTK